MTVEPSWALDPRRHADGASGFLVLWPVWAVQVHARHIERGDAFARLALRLLRSELAVTDEMAAASGFPEDLVRTILRYCETKGWASQSRGEWSLEEAGAELLDAGAAEGDEVTEWMFVCGRSGDVLPGRLSDPLVRDRRLETRVYRSTHREATRPDLDSLNLRVHLNRVARQVDRLDLDPLEDPIALDEFQAANYGELGGWSDDPESPNPFEVDPEEESAALPAPAAPRHAPPTAVIPTGTWEKRHLLLPVRAGTRRGEVVVSNPLGVKGGDRFYATRIMNDRVDAPGDAVDGGLHALRELLQQETLAADAAAAVDQASSQLRTAVAGDRFAFGSIDRLPSRLRGPFVEAEVQYRLAAGGAGLETAATRLRVLVEQIVRELESTLPTGLPAPIEAAESAGARRKLAKAAVKRASLVSGDGLGFVSRAVNHDSSGYLPLRFRIARVAIHAAMPQADERRFARLFQDHPGFFMTALHLVDRLNPAAHGNSGEGASLAQLVEEARTHCVKWLTSMADGLVEHDG